MDVLHPALNVADMDSMIDFYENVLGLEKSREFEVGGQYSYVVGGDNPAEIQFMEVSEAPDPTALDHLAIGVDDLDAVVEEAVSEWDSTVEMEPTEVGDGGTRIAFITDPEGYTLELIEGAA